MDILASLAKLMNVELPEGLDSQEYLDVFLGKSDEGRESMIVEANGKLAYRDRQYAMLPPYKGNPILNTGTEVGIVPNYSLYDLTSDIGQQNDLSKERPEVLEQIKTKFYELTEGYYKPTVGEIKLE